jgi:hypothetical protein
MRLGLIRPLAINRRMEIGATPKAAAASEIL